MRRTFILVKAVPVAVIVLSSAKTGCLTAHVWMSAAIMRTKFGTDFFLIHNPSDKIGNDLYF